MSKSFLTPIDLGKNELRQAVIQNLSSAPGSPVEGQIYYDTTAHALFWRAAAAWVNASGVSLGSVTAQTAFGASSADGSSTSASHTDHTHGTPTHDGSAHSAIKLSDLGGANATDVSLNSHKLTNVSDPTSAQDAATKIYVDTFTQGFDFKVSVKAAASTNNALTTAYENGDVIDGVTLATGDRILLAAQTTVAENGIWVVAASGSPTRAVDADTSGDISKGALVFIEGGTANGGQLWVCTATAATPWVPGTNGSTWTVYFFAGATQAGGGLTATSNVLAVGASTGIVVNADNIAVDRATNGAKVALTYAANVGDNSTLAYVITHSLGSRDCIVQVFDNTTPWAYLECDIEATSTTTTTLRFTVAPTTNQYRVVIMG